MSFFDSLRHRLGRTKAGDAAPAVTTAASAPTHPNEAEAESERRAGNAALQAGNAGLALTHYERFAALRPSHASAHLNKGFALLRLGRLAEAEAAMRQADRLDPNDAEAAYFLAQVLLQQGQALQALEMRRQAVARKPSFVHGWLALAESLEQAERHLEALDAHRVASRLDAQCVPAWLGLARCALREKDPAGALQALEQALKVQPSAPHAWGMRADALRAMGRHDEALQAAARALELDGADPRLLQTRGECWLAVHQYREAEADLRAALSIAPDQPDALAALGTALSAQGQHEAALEVFARSFKLNPDHPDAHHNRAYALMSLLRHEEAARELALALTAGHGDSRLALDLAVAQLTVGLWSEGWRNYEGRFKKGALPRKPGAPEPVLAPELPWPRWSPGDDDSGATVYVHAEQGLGDTLQFLRYVPAALSRGVRVLLQAQPRIVPLLSVEWPGCTLVASVPAAEQARFECPLMSLPHVLGLGPPLPMDSPYVHARTARRAHWRERLAGHPHPRIGLVWAGNPDHPDDARRSLPLEPLRQALQPLQGVRFVSLQMELRERDREAFQRWPELLWIGAEQGDMADTAALIEELDGVVCVDTSVAHLTGALGRPLWLLLMHNPDWRWGLGGVDTPWYPSARLVRQVRPGDWPGALQALHTSLLALPGIDGANSHG